VLDLDAHRADVELWVESPQKVWPTDGQRIALEPAAAASLVHPPMSVARLWRDQGKRTPARELLALV